LVIYDASATQLTDVSGLVAPLVKHVLLPVAHYLGFKAEYPSHRSKGGGGVAAAAAADSQEQQQQEEVEEVGSASAGHEEL
jgi:hypothetical protein